MDFSKLLNAIDKTSAKKSYADSDDKKDFWNITEDKAGNGTAIIRFLPDANIDEIPFVRIYSYGFKNEETGKWYIENSLQTIGQEDPVNDLKRKWWNSKDLDEQEKAKKLFGRRTNYTSNILVISDPANPENEGKVFKFRYGQKIFDKIVSAAKPEFEDTDPVNAFDPMNGADFRMKIKKVAGYRNYDDSAFGPVKPLFKGDQAKIDSVLSQCHNIQALVGADQFKSYDELKKKLETVLGLNNDSDAPVRRTTAAAEDDVSAFVQETKKVEPSRKAPAVASSTEDDDDLEFFRNLVDND